MIINFLLNLYLLVRLYQLYGENKLFTIQGLLLIFPIFYLSIPLYLYNIIDKLQIQNLLLDNINTDLIIYNINLLIFSVILISYMKIKRKSNTLKIIPIYRYILYLLFSINLLIFLHQLTYTNYSDLINFDRNALFQAYKSHSQNSYTFISRVLLIALAGSYAIYKNDIKYFLFLSPIVLSDVFILGRTFILMVVISFLSYFSFRNKDINLKKLILFLLLVFFMRNILINFNFTFDFNQGSFEMLGEFMNTFAGVLMVSDNNLEPNNTLVDFFISSIKPLILNKYIHIGWPIIDVPAMGINNFFKDSYGIYGLAGSIVSEMILYKDYNIVIILWLMLFVFIVNTMQKINSFTIKIYYIFILIQIPSIFRWSGLVFISSNINLFIYIFVPLIIAEYIILKKSISIEPIKRNKHDDN